jgi:uncharacterized protein YkwD
VPGMRMPVAMMAVLAVLAVPASAAGLTSRDRAERRMTSAINQVRAQHGLPAFERSGSLTASAERYSSYLIQHDVFTHQSSIWASKKFAMLGEALAWHSGRRYEVGSTIRAWLGSPTHRAILLSPVMRRQGAGVTRGRFGSRAATIWVLHVGRLTLPGPRLPSVQLP